MFIRPMTDEITPSKTVLEALKETCEQVRRHNPNPEVAREALRWEMKFAAQLEPLATSTGGAGREAATGA